jgi:pimeloyl-ACP methyl ester carboxylesterase
VTQHRGAQESRVPHKTIPGVIWEKDRTVSTADGAEIAYTFLGPDDAPVVALCAGLLCPDTWWHYLAPALVESGHRVLIFHYRGMGSSTEPEDDNPRAYAIDRCASDLADIVAAEGLDRLSVVGHSMGVQVAIEACRLLGDRVIGLVAITGPFASPIRSLYNRGTLMTFGVYHPVRLLLRTLPGPVRRTGWNAMWSHVPMLQIGKLFRAFGPRTDDAIVASYLEHAASLDPAMVLKIASGMHAHDASDVLPDLAVPTLVIAGGKDPFTPPSQAQRMAELVPDATLQVLPNGTHGAILEYPEVVNGWVLDFLERIAAPASARVG